MIIQSSPPTQDTQRLLFAFIFLIFKLNRSSNCSRSFQHALEMNHVNAYASALRRISFRIPQDQGLQQMFLYNGITVMYIQCTELVNGLVF